MFPQLASDVLGEFLAQHEFRVEFSEVTLPFAHVCFRRSESYVMVHCNEHGRDAIEYGGRHLRVTVGEGSPRFPDSDWNGVALWQLARASKLDGGEEVSDGYIYNSSEEIRAELVKIRKNLERYAGEFLSGDLGTYRSIRTELAKLRQPYRIGKWQQGGYRWEDDPISTELKRKYSNDNADEDFSD